MEELKPKIKPKAPASLKQNVLRAIQQEEREKPKVRIVSLQWASVAAIAFIGILTFALWPKESKPLAQVKEDIRLETPNTKTEEKTYIPSPILAHTPQPAKILTHQSYQARKEKAVHASPTVEKQELEIIELTQEEKPQEMIMEDVPSAEPPQMALTPYERQLIENMEEHRDLVRACLTEELLQAAFKQRQIIKIRQDYMQDAIQLYDSINQSIQKGIFEVKQPEEKGAKQV